jgi:hypothetical protein
MFTRHGMQGVIAAMFILRRSTLYAPLAGSAGAASIRLLDGLGYCSMRMFHPPGAVFSRRWRGG